MSQISIDIVQTVISLLALFGAIYAIILQRHEMSLNAELSAAASLLDYYNAKISSLRNSIIRDGGKLDEAKLESLETRIKRLEDLLDKHKKVVERLENLNYKAASRHG